MTSPSAVGIWRASTGPVGLNLSPAPTITDLASNALPATEPTIDETYTVDNTAPTADIVDITPDPRTTNAGTVNITFGESVTGVDITDFTLTLDATPVALTGLIVSGSGASYTVDLSTVTAAAGTYLLTLNASGSGIIDSAGNALVADASDTWDLNAPPTDIALSNDAILENTSTSGGTVAIGTLTATDPNSPQNHTFSLVAGDDDADNSKFTIVGGVLHIKQDEIIDFESQSAYLVRINVNDGLSNFEKAFTITVTDVNEAPTDIALSANTIVENTNTGAASVAIGSLSATDPDTSPTHTFSLVSGTGDTDNTKFEIVAGALHIRQGQTIDFEAQASYTVRVNVSDGTNDFAKVLTIDVTNQNEAPSITTPATVNAAENQVAVIDVQATDPEGLAEGTGLSYSLIGGVDMALFTIDTNSGVLTFQTPPDFEAPSDTGTDNVYNVQIQITDGTNNVTQDIAVTVTDANEAPTDIALSANTIVENTDTGAGSVAIGSLSATDPDTSPTHTFSLVSGDGDTDNTKFEIVAGALHIKQGQTVDFESQSTYAVRLNVSDGTNNFEKAFTVNVTDANEAPTDIALSASSIAENTDTGAGSVAIGSLSATDPDASPTHTFSLIAGNRRHRQRQIRDRRRCLAHQAGADHQLRGAVHLHRPPQRQRRRQQLRKGLHRQRHRRQRGAYRHRPQREYYRRKHRHRRGVRGHRLALRHRPRRLAHPHLLPRRRTGDTDNAKFEIVAGALHIRQGQTIDFESQPTYTVRLNVSDGANNFEKEFTVNVTDVNEAPTDIALSANTIVENTDTGTGSVAIGSLSATDPDASPTHTFSLVAGTGDTDNAKFEIVAGALHIRQGQTIDFESQPTYAVRVNVSDGTNNFEKEFTVNVTDANEAPTDIDLSASSIAENTDTGAASVAIGSLSAADPDASPTHTFSLVAGTGDNDNAKFEIVAGALHIRQGQTIDFEGQQSYSVRVNVNDGVNDFAQILSVIVTDQNEAPAPANDSVSIPESATNNTPVITVTPNDPDAGDSHTFAITAGNTGTAFAIDASGLITVADSNQLVQGQIYSLTVEVRDQGGLGLISNATISITITDVNTPPTAVVLNNQINSLPENTSTASDIFIADIVITDDGTGVNTINLAGPDAARFRVVGTQLLFKSGIVLNFEAPGDANSNNAYEVTVQIDDTTVGTTPDVFVSHTLSITNVNEPPIIALQNTTTSIAEGTLATSTKVADIVITDDALGTNTLTLSGADAALFEIVGGNGAAPQGGRRLDFESNPTLDVTVEVDDPALAPRPTTDAPSPSPSPTSTRHRPSPCQNADHLRSPKDTDTSSSIKVADIVITDDALGTNALTLSGADAALFEIVGNELHLKSPARASTSRPTRPSTSPSRWTTPPRARTPNDRRSSPSPSPTSTRRRRSPSRTRRSRSPKDTDTSSAIKVADIVITDDALGTNDLILVRRRRRAVRDRRQGAAPQVAGASLDFETNPTLDVIVEVDDPALAPDAQRQRVDDHHRHRRQRGANGRARQRDVHLRRRTPTPAAASRSPTSSSRTTRSARTTSP